MKICYIMKYPHWDKRAWGGENHCYNIAYEMSKHNKVIIINSVYNGYKKGVYWKKIKFICVDFVRKSFLLPSKKELEEYFNSEKFDIVHYYDKSGYILEKIKYKYKFKTVFSRFSDPIMQLDYKNKWDFIKKLKPFLFLSFYLEKFILKKVDIFTTTSKSLRKAAKISFSLNRKIYTIPRGVDSNFFNFSKYPDPNNIIFVANRIDPEKNTLDILRAINFIKKDIPNILVYIAGEGSELSLLKKYVLKNKLDNNVIFLNKINSKTMKKYYKKCNLFVTYSLCEGWGATVTEAMSIGRPIIASNSCGYIEQVISGENGYLVDLYNYRKLAYYIKKILLHPKLANKFAKKSREIVESKFSFKRESESYYKLYLSIIK